MDNIFSSIKKNTSSLKKSSSSDKKSLTHKKTSSDKNLTSHKSVTPESISIKVRSKSPQTLREFELKFPQPLPDKINFDEKISKKMNTLFNKHQDIKHFLGKTLFKDIFYLYLFNKYKTNCLITQKDKNLVPQIKIMINPDKPNINNETLNNLSEELIKCISINKPIIIIPLSLKMNIMGDTSGHANLLIYRNNTREIEHFEPHGFEFSGSNYDIVNDILNEDLGYLVKNMNIELDKKGLLPIKLVKARELCPHFYGLQGRESLSQLSKLPIESGGYCVAWSMFFTEMCLKNPEIPSKQIYEAMLNETGKHDIDYLKKVIRGYTCFINNKMAKYFSKILDDEITSEKLSGYHQRENTGKRPPEMKKILDQLNFLINEEAYPFEPKDMSRSMTHAKTLRKYNKFKKTIRKSTSSSDLSDETRESRHNMKQLQTDYREKRMDFVDKIIEKEKERKATQKLRKAEEKERKATEQAEEKKRKATEKLRKAEEKLLSKTAKSRPKTSKAKTLKMTSSAKSSPNP